MLGPTWGWGMAGVHGSLGTMELLLALLRALPISAGPSGAHLYPSSLLLQTGKLYRL